MPPGGLSRSMRVSHRIRVNNVPQEGRQREAGRHAGGVSCCQPATEAPAGRVTVSGKDVVVLDPVQGEAATIRPRLSYREISPGGPLRGPLDKPNERCVRNATSDRRLVASAVNPHRAARSDLCRDLPGFPFAKQERDAKRDRRGDEDRRELDGRDHHDEQD
jgi:hypothetical protein